MGRAPCCEKVGLKRGRWTAEEDGVLMKYIAAHGEGSWRSLPKNAGLLRCGKSCRLRWINYLRADLKRGNISREEEETIVKLHASLGNSIGAHHKGSRFVNLLNIEKLHRDGRRTLLSFLPGSPTQASNHSSSSVVRRPREPFESRRFLFIKSLASTATWSMIASYLPGRTDNEIKNYWNSHLSRKLHCFTKSNAILDHAKHAISTKEKCDKKSKQTASKKKKKKSSTTITSQKQTHAENGDVQVPQFQTEEAAVLDSTHELETELLSLIEESNGVVSSSEERDGGSLASSEESEVGGAMGAKEWDMGDFLALNEDEVGSIEVDWDMVNEFWNEPWLWNSGNGELVMQSPEENLTSWVI